MNKRRRKKSHVGEFRCLAFQVAGQFKVDDTDIADKFLDDAIDFAEKHGLGIGGGCSKFGFSFVVQAFAKIRGRKHFKSVTCTPEHQRLVGEFLSLRTELKRSEVGSFFDSYHSSLEEWDASISPDWAEILQWPKN